REAPSEARVMSERSETATVAGGCFWCLEAVFENLQGVERVESGYAGGSPANPTHQAVRPGSPRPAEGGAVAVAPPVIRYKALPDVFCAIHDPTTLNRQGADVGTQYRSAIFTHSPEQEETAREVIAELQAAGIWDAPIVTQVEPLDRFWKAEDYHQGYFRDN